MKRLTAIIVTAGLAALAATAAEPPKLNYTAMNKLGWKLSIQCWTFNRLTTFETIDVAHSLGVRYIEMFPGQKMSPDNQVGIGPGMPEEAVAQLEKKLRDANVKVVAFGVTGIPKDEAGARKLFDWAKRLGIETINSEPDQNDREHFALLSKLCDEYKINVGLHNHPKASRYWDPDVALKAVEGYSKRVGLCADTGHWKRSGLVSVDCLKKAAGHIVASHFKDLNEQNHDVPFGTGANDAAGQLAEFKKMGFKGVFSIEYEVGGPELQDNVAKCVHWFSDQAGKLAK